MKTPTKIVIMFFCSFAFMTGTFLLSPRHTVFADTPQDLETQVSALLAQLHSLQSQLQTSPGVNIKLQIPNGFVFTRTLRRGARGVDVRYLQIILNSDPDTQVTTSGSETDYFGILTKSAVIRFQNKYAAEILTPANLKSGTGIVGVLTRLKLNAIIAASLPAVSPVSQTSGNLFPQTPIQNLPIPSPATSTPAPAAPSFSFNEINVKTRAALVNIICTTLRGGSFNLISGSGVVVDPRGVILTNAHVAEYFLLKDYIVPNYVNCVIRTGEPAETRYLARPLYISPQWIQANAGNITVAEPTGTGENDFALLLITQSTNPAAPLPSSFDFLPMDFTDEALHDKNPVLVAGYPAGNLGGISIQKDFYPVSSVVNIAQVYSFVDALPELFSIHGTVLAQHGSSGGAVVSSAGKLIGLIATATDAPTTGDRELNAITPSHMNRSFKERNTFSLQDMFAENDLNALADQFARDVAPALTKILTDELSR